MDRQAQNNKLQALRARTPLPWENYEPDRLHVISHDDNTDYKNPGQVVEYVVP